VLRRPRLWTCGGTNSPRGRTGHPTSGAPERPRAAPPTGKTSGEARWRCLRPCP
jgi:hypothetical protein